MHKSTLLKFSLTSFIIIRATMFEIKNLLWFINLYTILLSKEFNQAICRCNFNHYVIQLFSFYETLT